jgi:hypothetical protein
MEFPASSPLMITAMADYSENEQTNLINLLVNLRGKGRLGEVKRYLPFAFLAPEKFRLVARWGDEDFAFYKALWMWDQPEDEKKAKREFLALRKEHEGKILAWPFWVEIKPMNVSRPSGFFGETGIPKTLKKPKKAVAPPPPPPAEESESEAESESDSESDASSVASEAEPAAAEEAPAAAEEAPAAAAEPPSWDEVLAPAPAAEACEWIMKVGDNKGKPCGKKPMEGETKCGTHLKMFALASAKK